MVYIITGWTTCHLTDYLIVFLGSLSSFDVTSGSQELEILSETLTTADSRQLSTPPDTHFVELGDSISRVPTVHDQFFMVHDQLIMEQGSLPECSFFLYTSFCIGAFFVQHLMICFWKVC